MQLTQILRGTWEFDGYITSDSGAIGDIYKSHHFVKTAEEAVGAALKAGCDINSGGVYSGHLLKALEQGAVNETTVDAALERAFQVRMRLGLFDPPSALPASYSPPPEAVGSAANHQLSYEASTQGLCLLQNNPPKSTRPDGTAR